MSDENSLPKRCLHCGVDLRYYDHLGTCQQLVPSISSAELNQAAFSKELGGTKHDSAKPRMDLLDPIAMEQLAAVLTFGATKYSAHNWRKGISSSRLLAAALRHIFAYLAGKVLDEESNLPHLAHAMCCLMFAINLAITKPELTDHITK